MSEDEIHSAVFDRSDPPRPSWMRRSRTRTRSIYGAQSFRGDDFYQFQTPQVQTNTLRVAGTETTSDTLGAYRGSKPTPHWDKGGNFNSRKVWFEPGQRESIFKSSLTGKTTSSYTGTLFADSEVSQLARHINSPLTIGMPNRFSYPVASRNEINTHGATAINRTIPIAPDVSVAQTIGELKQGLPDLGLRALRRGDVAGEFLNQNFAVLPTIADFKAYRDTAHKSEAILAQWRRDSGRRIRRRYTFDDEVTETQTVLPGSLSGVRGPLNGQLVTTQSCMLNTRTTRRWWFAGAYSYVIPPSINDLHRKMQDYNRLWGLAPTPDTVWNLSPFSWLLDWETNIGDVISNVSLLGKDGLVLTYGYIMCHTNVRHEYVWRGDVYSGKITRPLVVRSVVNVDVKQREQANPYGLGWTIESLSAKQIAILAALGHSFKS